MEVQSYIEAVFSSVENKSIKGPWRRNHIFLVLTIYVVMIIGFAVMSYTILIKDLKSDLGNKAMVLSIDITHWLDVDKPEYDRLLSLSFAELFEDPTNRGFEHQARDVMERSEIKYIYLLSELPVEKAKYRVEAGEESNYNAPAGTLLTGIYVLDSVQTDLMREEDAGSKKFDDKVRYTILRPEIKRIINERVPAFILNTDEWGTYLTGFAPYYTESGEFLGMLGVDLFPDKYYAYIKRTVIIFGVFLFTMVLAGLLFSNLLKRVWKAEERIRLESELATKDPTTGLMNKSSFVNLLNHEYATCRREGMPLTLMLADLEAFEVHNQVHGEEEGSRVLMAIADFLRTRVKRGSDALCRFGGDEFAFFLHNTEAENAIGFAELLLGESPYPISLGILVIMPDEVMDTVAILEKLEETAARAYKIGTRKYVIMDETY